MKRRHFLLGLAGVAACGGREPQVSPGSPPAPSEGLTWYPELRAFDVTEAQALFDGVLPSEFGEDTGGWMEAVSAYIAQLSQSRPGAAALLGAAVADVVLPSFVVLRELKETPPEGTEEFLARLSASAVLPAGSGTAVSAWYDEAAELPHLIAPRSQVADVALGVLFRAQSLLLDSGLGNTGLLLRLEGDYQRAIFRYRGASRESVYMDALEASALRKPPSDTGEPFEPLSDAGCSTGTEAWENYLRTRAFLMTAFEAVAETGELLDVPYSPANLVVKTITYGTLAFILPFLLHVPQLPTIPVLRSMCQCQRGY